jgi:putative addiction module component (TIGR02574 family)
MSHAEIIAELPKLSREERLDILNRLSATLEEDEQPKNGGPSEAEKKLLDQEWEEYQRDKDPGTPWREFIAELRSEGRP